MSCFFGLNDKISSMTYNSSENNIVATQEFVCPDTQAGAGVNTLISLALSPDHLHLIGAFSNKAVVCWDVRTGALMGQAVVHKKPTALLCSTLPEHLSDQVQGGGGGLPHFALVSDKGGEVWAYGLPSLSVVCKVLGHTSSVITDMTLAPQGNRIVTADRDEKIRLTAFPATSTIAGFCLGHTDVVTSMSFVPPPAASAPVLPPLLVSSGWDHRLCLWDAEHCEQLDVLELASSSSSSTTSQDQGQDQGGEQPDAKEQEDEAAADKVYDETKAGHFPLRIVSCSGSGSGGQGQGQGQGGLFAVLFWHKPEIHLRQVVRAGQGQGQARFLRREGGDGQGQEQEQECAVLALPAAPIDCMFVEEDGRVLLLVLLPAPHYLLTVTCSLTPGAGAGTGGEEEGKWAAVARHFAAVAAQNGE